MRSAGTIASITMVDTRSLLPSRQRSPSADNSQRGIVLHSTATNSRSWILIPAPVDSGERNRISSVRTPTKMTDSISDHDGAQHTDRLTQFITVRGGWP